MRITSEPSPPPVTGLGSASTTVLREHARRMRQIHQATAATSTSSSSSPSTGSLAGRLKRKFQQMAEHQFQTLLQQQESGAEASGPLRLSAPTTTSPEAAQEFQRDVTATVLHWVAKGIHMDPRRLEGSPALRELLLPYLQWMGNAPCWMQFTGLLMAKKCQDWSGLPMEILGSVSNDVNDIVGTSEEGVPLPSITWTPPSSAPSPEFTTSNPERWMSSSSPAAIPEYIDVDAQPSSNHPEEESSPSSSSSSTPPDPDVVDDPSPPTSDSGAAAMAGVNRSIIVPKKTKKSAKKAKRTADRPAGVADQEDPAPPAREAEATTEPPPVKKARKKSKSRLPLLTVDATEDAASAE